MADSSEQTIRFGAYLRCLLRVIIPSTVTLALLACILILAVGETSMNLEIGLEIERTDGLWVLLGLPAIAILLFVLISPISFLLYRLQSRRTHKDVPGHG